MNIRSTAAAIGMAATLVTSPVLAEELDKEPVKFLHNVALDAEECALTADAISYDYAISTGACKRFVNNAQKSIREMDDDYYRALKEENPGLLLQVVEDMETVQQSARRMRYLSQQ